MIDASTVRPGKIRSLLKKALAKLKWISFGYIIAITVLALLIRVCGERYWMTATAIYLPPTIALLPLAVLLPACLRFNRRLCWLQLLAVPIVFFLYLRPHFSSQKESTGRKIKIVTNNVGQRKPTSVTHFVNEHDPDIVAFQEASNRQRFLKKEYPNRFVAVHDEFALVSKWPIKAVGYVPDLFSHYGYAAAWFEVDCDGKSIIVYNIHMPTPRPDFVKLRGKGFSYSLFRGEGVFSSKIRADYKQAMRDRVEEGRKLAEVLAKETRPFVAVGDFNMPDTGFLYRVFASQLTDVFATRGNGYGLTFPGFTRNPLSLFGPWLRIDYIFVGQHCRPLSCEVESRQNAQHLAIAAELEFVDKK